MIGGKESLLMEGQWVYSQVSLLLVTNDESVSNFITTIANYVELQK